MTYSPKQYALALRSTMEEKTPKEQKNILRNFLRVIVKNRDLPKLNLIVTEIEREDRKTKGILRVEISTPDPASERLKTEIKKNLGNKILFAEKIEPGLLAGVKIMIENETLIDATAKNQLSKIFKNDGFRN